MIPLEATVVLLTVAVLVFALGTMFGATWMEQILAARSRRQAAWRRQLNDEAGLLREGWHQLQERQEAFEEKKRSHCIHQANIIILVESESDKLDPHVTKGREEVIAIIIENGADDPDDGDAGPDWPDDSDGNPILLALRLLADIVQILLVGVELWRAVH